MEQEQNWTLAKTLLALFIVLDLIIIGAWLLAFFQDYQNVATVVGGIWAALVGFLGFLGIRGGNISSLSELFDLRPIKYIGFSLTILILVSTPLFILWEFKVHEIEIGMGEIPASIQILNNIGQEVEKSEYPIKEFKKFHASLRQGRYEIVAAPKDSQFDKDSQVVNIHWLQLSKTNIVFDKFPARQAKPATLQINTQPADTHLTVTHIERGTEVYSADINSATAIKNLLPGDYLVNIQARSTGYSQYSRNISLAPEQTLSLSVNLEPLMGSLYVRPSEDNMVVFVNGERRGNSPLRITLKPKDDYIVELLKQSPSDQLGFYYKQKPVVVSANQETPIVPTDINPKRLGTVRLHPDPDNNNIYRISDRLGQKYTGPVPFGKTVPVFPGKVIVQKLRGTDNQPLAEESYDIALGQSREARL